MPDWIQWKEYVLRKLDELSNDLKDQQKSRDTRYLELIKKQENLTKMLQKIHDDFVYLRARSGFWGLIGGLLSGIIGIIAMYLKSKL